MECFLNKESIKEAIQVAVNERVTQHDLLKMEDGVITLLAGDPLPLTPEQDKMVEEAMQYADNIKGAYKESFKTDPVAFLREIAHQANNSTSENITALTVSGIELYDLATKLFPTQGILDKAPIQEINKAFKSEVLTPINNTQYKIEIPNKLVLQYLARQEGSKDQLIQEMRDAYLAQYSEHSLNLMDEELWLKHPLLQDANTVRLLQFAKKINPNFRAGIVDGLDQNAVSLIRDYTILIGSGRMLSELPEEISHFFIELMDDTNPLKVSMLKEVLNHPIYGETLALYKNNPAYQNANGTPDYNKIKREAAARLLAKFVTDAWEGKEKKKSTLKDIISQIIKWLRKIFNQSINNYTEPTASLKSFIDAAGQINSGDISNLNIQRVPSNYDSIFFSALEEQVPEFDYSDIAKGMYQLARSIRNTVNREFRDRINSDDLKGIKEILNDPKYENVSRIFDITAPLKMFVLEDIKDDELSPEQRAALQRARIVQSAEALAEAYREMEMIPLAIKQAINKMSKDKTTEQLADNFKELQAYMGFSQTFKRITESYIELLGYIQEQEGEMGLNTNDIYNRMKNGIGNTQLEFAVVDEEIMRMVKNHIGSIMINWTDELYKSHTNKMRTIWGELKTVHIRSQIEKELAEMHTSANQLLQSINGQFPNEGQLKAEDGSKIDISAIKDTSMTSNLVAMFSSPSLSGDPFISHLFKYFHDKYMGGVYEGGRESKLFADSILPTLDTLTKNKLDYYQAQRLIQNVQDFYDPALKDNKTQKRVLLSETDRFNFNFQKQTLYQAYRDKLGEMAKVQEPYRGRTDLTPEEKQELKDKVGVIKDEAAKLKEAFDDFIEKYSHKEYTQDYYNILAQIRVNKNDSPALKRIKEINKAIRLQHDMQAILIGTDSLISEQEFEDVTIALVKLQDEKRDLALQLPATDVKVFELMDEIFEEDKVATERMRARHKKRWISDVVRVTLNKPDNVYTREQAERRAELFYTHQFEITRPKQEFYDARTAIFDKMAALSGTNVDLEYISKLIKELDEKRKDLLKNYRNLRYDVSISSFKYSRLDAETMTVEAIKEIEEEIDALRMKQRVYASLLSQDLPQSEKDRIRSYTEMLTGFGAIINNRYASVEKIQETFAPLMTLTPTQAQSIKDAIHQSFAGDHTGMTNLASLNPTLKNPAAEQAWAAMRFNSVTNMRKIEEQVLLLFKSLKPENTVRDQLDNMWEELNALQTKGVTFDYVVVMKEFYEYFKEYVENDDFDHPLKTLHAQKLAKVDETTFFTTDSIEGFLADEVMSATLEYLRYKETLPYTDQTAFAIDDYITFMLSIHKAKVVRSNEESIETYTPVSYATKIMTDDNLTQTTAPRFLTATKVKDQYMSEKINELDPRVQAGTHKANVDINGQWLPLPDPKSPFYNKEYAALRDGKDDQSKQAFKLLNNMKRAYLTKQVEMLAEGERLDTVIPAKQIDAWEAKKLAVTSVHDNWASVKNAMPWAGKGGVEEEDVNYKEEIGAITIENRSIYSGQIIRQKQVKLNASRRVPIQRQSEDALAAIAMFMEEVHIFDSKREVAPIFKSFADGFADTHAKVPSSNKIRSQTLRDLETTKMYDEKPDNFANNENVARILKIVNKTVTLKLWMDPFGAVVNLTGGVLQNLIEKSWSKEEYANYMKATGLATKWAMRYEADFYKKATWGLETQLINMFNFIPGQPKVSEQVSHAALAANVSAKAMALRTYGENFIGIQLGLALLASNPVEFNGKRLHVHELYELDPATTLIRVKPEYTSLEKDWDPVNGLQVQKMRGIISQKFTLLQGNFFDINQSWISYTAIGKSAELMKRWAATGIIRRYQGVVLDPYLGESRIGYHKMMMKLAVEIGYSARTMQLDTLKEWWNVMNMDPVKKAALRRSFAEMVYTAVFGMLVALVLGYSDGDDDKNKKLKEASWWKQAAILMAIRIQGELGTFIPVPLFGLGYTEMKRMIMDPLSIPVGGVNNAAGVLNLLISQAVHGMGIANLEDKLYYKKDQGYDSALNTFLGYKGKGDSKLWAMMLNTVGYMGYTADPEPYIKVINTLQNRVK